MWVRGVAESSVGAAPYYYPSTHNVEKLLKINYNKSPSRGEDICLTLSENTNFPNHFSYVFTSSSTHSRRQAHQTRANKRPGPGQPPSSSQALLLFFIFYFFFPVLSETSSLDLLSSLDKMRCEPGWTEETDIPSKTH